MARKTFPKADQSLATEVYHLGRASVSRFAELTRDEVFQSVQAAFTAHETGISLSAVLAPRTHLCGPRRKRR